MQSIFDAITEWLKGLLVEGIMGNLGGLFTGVNEQVGEIAAQVGMTPAAWNAGVFSMIRQLSETVILPIAGLVLTFVMTYELIQMLIDHNNLHNFDTWIFFKWIFKTFVAVLILSNTFNIVMAVFDVSQQVIQQSAGLIQGSTAVTPDVLNDMQIMASELSDKLLAELLEVDAEMTITMHIQTVDQAKAIKTIKGKVSDIDKMKVEEQKKAVRSGYDMDILPPDLVTFSQDAKNLLNDLQSRNERMFLLTFLVVNTAATRRELDNDLFTVSGIMQKYNCLLKRLDFQQEQGLVSSLPLGYNGIEIQRGMTTSSTAIFVPFMTQELRMDGEAIYYGLNALSHNVIMANRKKLKNPNGLYLGVPGSGKSFSGKRELVNVFLATNDRIIILDPMGEYSPLVRQFGKDGLVVEIAPNSPHFINPMDLDLSMDDEVSPISLKCDFILSLMELIVGGKDGLQPVERTIIDRCARMVYRDLLNDPEHAPMPTLQDLYDLLCQQSEPEAKRLATALEIYVSGSLNLFNHKTNVDYKNARVLCFDLKKLGSGLRKIAMHILNDLSNNQVSYNFSCGIATWCYYDEFHVLLQDELTSSYFVTIWKMLRKKGCVPSALTQNVKDLLASRQIENIFENSDFMVLLSQAQGDRQILAKQLGISPHQLSYVTHSNPGEGLLFFGNVTIPFVDRFPKNTKLYSIMTTRPEEKEAQNE